jgi:hypothetical protein
LGGATIGETIFACVCIKEKCLKIFFSRITKPERFKLTWQFADIVQMQVCSNHGPRGLGGATIGKTIFTCVYIGKMFKNLLLKNY